MNLNLYLIEYRERKRGREREREKVEGGELKRRKKGFGGKVWECN